ncbi:conserved hypothetical protein [Frankia sp. AiPs1]
MRGSATEEFHRLDRRARLNIRATLVRLPIVWPAGTFPYPIVMATTTTDSKDQRET